MKIGIIDICKQIEDPRMDRKKVHKMETIIYISIAATICGAQSWNEIEAFGNAKFDFFKSRFRIWKQYRAMIHSIDSSAL